MYSGKVTVFGKKWLYSGKGGCVWKKWWYSWKVVIFGQELFYSAKDDLYLQKRSNLEKCLYSGKVFFIWAIAVFFGQK